MNKIKEELDKKINILEQQMQIYKEKENVIENDINNNKIDLEPINILKKEMNRLSKDLKNINEKKIPEIYILIENLGKTGNNSNSQNLIKQGGEFPMTRSRRNNARSILDNINNNN